MNQLSNTEKPRANPEVTANHKPSYVAQASGSIKGLQMTYMEAFYQ